MAKKHVNKNHKNNLLNKINEPSQNKRPKNTSQKISEIPKILHRETQKNQIIKWLQNTISIHKSAFLYIFGPPGTGKTALAKSLKCAKSENLPPNWHYINCMSAPTFKELTQSVRSEVGLKNSSTDMYSDLSTAFPNLDNIIIVLDELDQSMIPQILEKWTRETSSLSLIVIGIANCLSPHSHVNPENTIAFPPYTANELSDIIKAKLKGTIDQVTVELISKKVAGTCGDVRKALSLSQTVHEATADSAASPKTRRAKMLALVCQYSQKTVSVDDSMPLQQKIIACALVLTDNKFCLLGKLHENYCAICRQKLLPMIDFTTFNSLCELMAASGVVRLVSSKNIRSTKVYLGVDDEEMRQMLSRNELLGSILNKLKK